MYIGEKVRLREYRKEDVVLAHQYINDPEIKNGLVKGIPFPITLEEENKWFEQISSFKSEYNFAIEDLNSREYIGGCGINSVDWKNSVAVVGIFVGKKYCGKGLGTDAMKTLIKFIFNQMNINKIKLCVYSFNKRAIKSYEKCGFIKEGILRQEVYRNGKYHDEYIMSILREEYKF